VRAFLVIAILLGFLGAAAALAFWGWQSIGDVQISGLGLIALGLGVVLSVVLGAGLMALMFFSSRRGYDERAHDADPTRVEWPRADFGDER
jgi:hypothetical protein